MPFMLLITFQALLSKIKLHMSAFLGHLQTITTFAPSILLVSFFFNHMSITNLNLGQGFIVFLAMAKLKRGIGVMIMSPIVFVSPEMLSFGNIVFFFELSHFRASLSSSSVLDLFPDEAHIPSVATPDPPVVTHDSPIDFSVQPPDIIDPFPSSPFNEHVEDEQVEDKLPNPNPELRSPAPAPPKDLAQEILPHHSTWVRSIPAHLLDYHCYTTLATLHEPHTYLEASIDPLWQIAMEEELDTLSKNHT